MLTTINKPTPPPHAALGVQEPYRIAADTWVIPELVPGPPGRVVRRG